MFSITRCMTPCDLWMVYMNFPQIWPKMPQNGPKWPKYDPKWPKNNPKWPKNDPHFFRNFFDWNVGSANFFAFRMYVGRLGWCRAPVQCTRCTFWYLAYLASNQLISTFFLLYIRLLSGKSCLFICRYRDYLPLIRLAHLFHPAPSGQSPLHFAFVAKARVNLSSSNLSSTFCPFSPVLSIFLWNWHTLSQSIRN